VRISSLHRSPLALAGALGALVLLSGSDAHAEDVTPAEAHKESESKKDSHWYDALNVGLIADAYGSYNYNRPTPQTPLKVEDVGASGGHGGLPYKGIRGGNQLRGYDVTNGFALQWVGIDATYTADPVSVVTTLRFGPGALLLATPDDIAADIHFVRQAYVSWKALPSLTLDLGKYDTPYGAESLDNTNNINYTRTHIFWYAQPGMHTGLRATFEASSSLSFQGMLVNGWDATIPRNAGKSVGALAVWKPLAKAKVSAGYMVGPEGSDHEGPAEDRVNVTGRLRHFADLFFDGMLTDKWRLLFNVDYVTEKLAPSLGSVQASWYGGTLASSYDFKPWIFGAVRGSHFWDDKGFATGTGTSLKVVEGTVTLGLRPAPGFLLMLDNRVDWTPYGAFFQTGDEGTSRTQVTTTLGFCVTTPAP
jgi:hypothetical protein